MSADVVGFGENSLDFVYRVQRLPRPGQKVRATSCATRPGGQVATAMAACAALGARSRYVGTFGSDEGGTTVRTALLARGVDLQHALRREASNRYAVILVDEGSGERAILWDRDSRLAIEPGQVRSEWVEGARLVHVDASDEQASIALARMASPGAIVTCDVDTVTPLTGELFEAVTDPVFAEGVPSALTGEADHEKALRQLRNRHPGRLVVTLGSGGAMMLERDVLVREPAFRIDVVDTTGAGDVFRAGFICGLLRGLSGRPLLRFANAAAALSCTRAGAIDSVPSVGEVEQLLVSA